MKCEEIYGHGVTFEDEWDNIQVIIMATETIVSIRRDRKDKEVSSEERLSQTNVFIDAGHIQITKGGQPFRLLEWVKERKFASIIVEVTDARLATVSVCIPQLDDDVIVLRKIQNVEEGDAIFTKGILFYWRGKKGVIRGNAWHSRRRWFC